MPYPFLRPGERTRTSASPEVGVRVLYGTNGVCHFFPGPSVAAAFVVIDRVVPPDLLNHPDTRVEFGERVNGRWVTTKILKAPPPRV